MPNIRQSVLSDGELNQTHLASMEILSRGGVTFHHDRALELFRSKGFRVSGKKVYIEEKDVRNALETAPERFEAIARAPQNSRWIGGDDYVLVPTYGPPFIIEEDGTQRPGTLADYETAVKLNQTSPVADITGFKYVAASDIAANSAYLEMLKMSLTLTDKPIMGSTDDEEAARDAMEILKLVFGEKFREKSVAIGLINPLSPLAYADDMAGSIMVYAENRQPLIILDMILAGSSGPIQLAGLIALMNAELLAGLVLAQLAGPGTPVIYGTTSCPIYMKTGAAAVGNPETLLISGAALDLARFYKLPCRTGGSLTDALAPDGQAMAEGALSALNSLKGGVNFVLHAFGMIGGYIGLSLEKWIMDEDLWQYAKIVSKGVSVTAATLCPEEIINVGSGGSYLTQPETMKLCREAFYSPKVFNKFDDVAWRKFGGRDLGRRCRDEIAKRVNSFQKPDIDPSLEKDLNVLIDKLKVKRGQRF
ncbi:MAG: trimethylamine methyltransferase family protein [Deltaproteobacteria bacterium]|jgi:trimethylamine--corrinoid protein Co-methyltransferase|nr:trimethylamine methyltransferase family protein [Deltaproteobacteria bacterium]